MDAICVPMNVDAFVLNKAVCDDGLVQIAPITQPDYRGLRINNREIRPDILPSVDMRQTQPASLNSRISVVENANENQVDPGDPASDINGIPPLRTNRIGVYVHWSLPRMYRAGTSASVNVEKLPTGENVSPSPTFRLVPNRWLVIRKITTSQPKLSDSDGALTAWIVESDRMRKLTHLGPDIDIQTDVSPFVADTVEDRGIPGVDNSEILDKQAAVFIGDKIPLSRPWTEQGSEVSRVDLTIMNSSNFCFADNAVHNPNVFSMVDNLNYSDSDGETHDYLEATCDYTVIGWHSEPMADPLGNGSKSLSGTLEERLKVLFCKLVTNAGNEALRNSDKPMRTVSYGTILNVKFSRHSKPKIPSETFAQLFLKDSKVEPVAVGTTVLDSTIAFLQAHSMSDGDPFAKATSPETKDILALRQLLYDREDSSNSQWRAADSVFAQNFLPSSGGHLWHYGPDSNQEATRDRPTSLQLEDLSRLNDLQLRLDAANRKLKFVRWLMFAAWWKYVSDPANMSNRASYSAEIVALRKIATRLRNIISYGGAGRDDPLNGLQEKIIYLAQKLKATRTANAPFFQRKDPTITLAGTESGWPLDYIGFPAVQVAQLLSPPPTTPPAIDIFTVLGTTRDRMPSGVVSTIEALVRLTVLEGADHSADVGFKTWADQPWCPLYIEWTATYFHVPFSMWAVGTPGSPSNKSLSDVRYGIIKPLEQYPQSSADQMNVSGRAIVTPQPVVTLQTLVSQVLGTVSSKLTGDINDLQSSIAQLKMVSAELTGLTSNLLTVSEGAHVQPNFHKSGDTVLNPLEAAVRSGSPIGMTREDFKFVAGESALTPFASIIDFRDSTFNPFKPVTHGQLQITKLNIVDKFGQVISAMQADKQQPVQGLPEALLPCLSEQACPGLIPDRQPPQLNTVLPLTSSDSNPPGDYPQCPFIQLTPAINQEARMHAEFLNRVTDDQMNFKEWKATNDWQSPVWAWVVVNFADYGLQFFTSEGVFYTQINVGGPNGNITGRRKLSFAPFARSNSNVSPQLTQLVERMTGSNGETYSRSLWNMITQAMESTSHAPVDYASTANALIGKPLALVNVGIGLELASPPLRSQTSLPPARPAEDMDLLSYKFAVKIGDAERPDDGVVGCFDTDTASGATDWSNVFTYFTSTDINKPPHTYDPRILLQSETFPTIAPFFVEPEDPFLGGSFTATRIQRLSIKTMIVDPYTPLHIYTGILPVKALQIPAWMVREAIQKMSSVFRLGPCFITKDVPITNETNEPPKSDQVNIRLPILTGKRESYQWLQPYVTDEHDEASTAYKRISVEVDDGRLRLDPGPYTLVEGFLQMNPPVESA